MDVITHSVVLLAFLILLILSALSLTLAIARRTAAERRASDVKMLRERQDTMRTALKDAADTLAELIANRSVYGDSKDRVISTYNTVTTALAEEKK